METIKLPVGRASVWAEIQSVTSNL